MSVVLAELTASSRHLPICLGLSGASTAKMKETLDDTADWPIDGYLIASPYYTRPSQRGLLQHFNALADHAAVADRALQHPLSHGGEHHQRDAAGARRDIRTSSA